MKRIITLLLAICPALVTNAQSEVENLIRDIERREITAVKENDVETLKNIWSKNIVVNSPFNDIVTDRDQIFGFMKSGRIKYSKFERTIEHIQVMDDKVVTMGHEELHHATTGVELKRRYTNIWQQDNGKWLLVIRHANVICQN